MLVFSASLLHDGKRAPHAAIVLEVTQHQHAVGRMTDVETFLRIFAIARD